MKPLKKSPFLSDKIDISKSFSFFTDSAKSSETHFYYDRFSVQEYKRDNRLRRFFL